MMMKKIQLYGLLAACCLASCSLDINEDPNHANGDNVTYDLVFPSIENSIAATVGGQMFNYGGFFAQYFEQLPESNQFNKLAEQNFQPSDALFSRCYSSLYSGALTDAQDVLNKTKSSADKFAATVLRVAAFQLLVDNTGETPYTDALKGKEGVASPRYDDGEVVYESVLAELDNAEKELTLDAVMTVKDPMLNQNVAQWKGYANALRLRMYMRMIDGGIDVAGYTEKVKALVQSGTFFTGNIAWDVYSDLQGQFNPWYDMMFALTSNHCAAYPIIAYMQKTNDPRIAYGFLKNKKDGLYVGQMPGAKSQMKNWGDNTDWKNDWVSWVNYSVAHAMPVYLFTQSNLQFLIAEAQLRFFNNAAAAKTAYEAAVKADFDLRGMSQDYASFMAGSNVSWDAATTQEAQLKLIYMQKWTAFFYTDHMEAWSEIRRTGVPELSPYTGKDIYEKKVNYEAGDLIVPTLNSLEGGGLVKRVYYSYSSIQYNQTLPPADELPDPSVPVFWDKK
jgi:hypothetical protein